MRQFDPFSYIQGELVCEEVRLAEIGREVGTPVYVYSETAVREQFKTIQQTFSPIDPQICYAVKANSNLAILKILSDLGSSFDIVSMGELFRLKAAGISADRAIYSGVGKTTEELKYTLEEGIFCLVVESFAELETLAEAASVLNMTAPISLRINPEVDAQTHPYISTGLRQHKFGIDLATLDPCLERIASTPELHLLGIGSHIGSQILSVQPFVDAFCRIKDTADQIRKAGFALEHLDLGGGFGISYSDEEAPPWEELVRHLSEERGDYKVIMEPGRFIVGKAGCLLTSVLYHKVNHEKHFIVVDGAMNDLIRPTLYGAYHRVLPVKSGPAEISADVVGPVCETADFLAKDRDLPLLSSGELLAAMDAGAYGFVAASNYNSRPRSAEVLVRGDSYRVIRKRETLDDLIRDEQ